MNEKLDLKKIDKEFYNPAKKPQLTVVPKWQFLMIDGIGAVMDDPRWQNAIQSLFGVSYKIKFACKKTLERDYAVMPLEGLWWADDMEIFADVNRKDQWKYTLMIRQPDFVDADMMKDAIEIVRKKDPDLPLDQLRLEEFEEGPAAQMMHLGPFSEEHENIMSLHRLIEENGGTMEMNHKHHEIYLSDFRRTVPEKLKTVLRQPYRP